MNTKEAVAKRILELCEERSMAVNALATVSGVSPSTIYSMLNEKSKNPGVVSLKKLCDGLEVKAVSNKETRFGCGVCHWRTDTARMVYLFLLS